jgi:sentrin-specific protease 1
MSMKSTQTHNVHEQIDLFSKDVVLIPINHGNAHWTAAAINFRRKRIESYDSMNHYTNRPFKVG